jgi:parvulin-like peptidyl-prolyl isomerase
VGAKSGQSKRPSAGKAGKASGFKRLALIVFGAIFVLLVVGFAIAQGIGRPGVASGDVALVEGVPDDIGTISEAEFKRGVAQQVAGAGLKKAPKPGSKKAEELKEAVLGEQLEGIWIRAEAEAFGLEVTDKQIETELAEIKKTNFPTATAFKEFLKSSKLSAEEVNKKVELQILSTKIQESVSAAAPPPTSSQIAESYEENKKAQFTTKPTRDVRIVINKDKGEAEAALAKLKADDSPANWKVVAAKYSADPSTKTKGGLLTGLSEELLASAGAVKDKIFSASTGEVVGPAKLQENYVVFEVEKLNPKKVQTLGEVRAQITSQLAETVKQESLQEFVTEYQSKWTSRTICAADFLSNSHCSNYKGSGHPEEAPAACYEANPKVPPKKGESLECPAPVTQTKPAVPGSVSKLKPTGEQLVQRPQPAGLKAAGGVAGAVSPEGVAPATGE